MYLEMIYNIIDIMFFVNVLELGVWDLNMIGNGS